ncbi:MAG: hypothetical protein M3364_08280 [Actinomycetota bacterium]|nr:hypothetical protein [Actinomycetota bacterium]
MARRRVSYAWALKVPAADAGSEDGLGWAQLLATNARAWRDEALHGGPRPYPLTPEELAAEACVSASTIKRRVAQARSAAFGSLSDSGIYYRVARAKEEAGREAASVCKAPDCESLLPCKRTRRREYCHPRCRRRHHYQRQVEGATRRPHLRGPRESAATNVPA